MIINLKSKGKAWGYVLLVLNVSDDCVCLLCQVVPEMRETHRKLETDPMFALEHLTDDVQKKSNVAPTMEKLEQLHGKWKDDYLLNKAARNKVIIISKLHN